MGDWSLRSWVCLGGHSELRKITRPQQRGSHQPHPQPPTNDRIGQAVGHRIIGLDHEAPVWELPSLPPTVRSREGFLVAMFLFWGWSLKFPQILGSSEACAVAFLPHFFPWCPTEASMEPPIPHWRLPGLQTGHPYACLKQETDDSGQGDVRNYNTVLTVQRVHLCGNI